MLRYRADLRTLAFIAAYFVILATAWRLWDGASVVARVGLVALLCACCWLNAVITHNTIHCPMWRSKFLNRLTQVVLSLSYGFPVSEFKPGHNLSHHRYTQQVLDGMRTSNVRYRWNLLNLLLFFLHVGPGVTAENMAYARRTPNRAWKRQLLLEAIVAWSFKLSLLTVAWQKGLALVLIPNLYAVWGITTINLPQHDGCDADHPYNHSRNFVGRTFNWLTFNNGFHGIHHMHPELHWSLLPKAHAEQLAPFIDPRLDRISLAGYLFEAFVYPGKRVRYDGEPVVLPPPEPTQSWVEAAHNPNFRNAQRTVT
ncbi:MAG TPA: fatty acid desaturase [Labilithrix sp.]|nr:fatty acid desaturase [Labilithrix sp.]